MNKGVLSLLLVVKDFTLLIVANIVNSAHLHFKGHCVSAVQRHFCGQMASMILQNAVTFPPKVVPLSGAAVQE